MAKLTKEEIEIRRNDIQKMKDEGISSKEIAEKLNIPIHIVKRNGKYKDKAKLNKIIKDAINNSPLKSRKAEKLSKIWNTEEKKEFASNRSKNFWKNLEENGNKEEFIKNRIKRYIESGAAEEWKKNHQVKANKAATDSKLGNFDSWQDKIQSIVERNGGILLTPYTKSKEYVSVKCSAGHSWEAIPNSIQQGKWCPQCANVGPSKGQIEVFNYIQTLANDVVLNDRSVLLNKETDNYLELDIYIPSKSFGIEFNGLLFHSDYFGDIRNRHLNKFKICEDNGIKLLAIFEDEWNNPEKQSLIKSMIRHRLGILPQKENRLRASKLELRKIHKNKLIEPFFDKNHLDGHSSAMFAYGLFKEDKLITCMSIRKNHNSEIEICRFATDYDYHVYGGAGRLLKAVFNDFNEVITFSNNRLSTGNVYKELNGVLIQENNPSYWYTDGKQRIWRWKCRRINDPGILAQFPDIPHTEKDQANSGLIGLKIFNYLKPLYRIEDYGHKKWLLKQI
jgi:hypothetical protein